MSTLFDTYLYEPILSVLVFIYHTVAFKDLGIAIVFFTLLVRVVLFPVFYKGAKDQALMNRLQPHIKKIQLDHKDNKEEQAKRLMALYREHRLNPFSGLFLLLLQLPIFIVLFQLFTRELATATFDNHSFLGLINLETRNLFVAFVAAGLQYFHGKLSLAKSAPQKSDTKNPLAAMPKMMVVMGPAITVVVLMNLPSALGLYWSVSTLFSVFQQLYINKKLPKLESPVSNTKAI